MSRKRSRAAPRGDPAQILHWIDKHGIVDKDTCSTPRENARAGAGPRRRTPRRTLDLHGLREEEAARALREAIAQCRRHGIRELLVVHGYGLHTGPGEEPVLKKLVRRIVECDPHNQIRDYRGASPREGGRGATLIYLR